MKCTYRFLIRIIPSTKYYYTNYYENMDLHMNSGTTYNLL